MTHANHALIRSSNQPVLSNDDKVSRKKRYIAGTLTFARLSFFVVLMYKMMAAIYVNWNRKKKMYVGCWSKLHALKKS